MNKPRRWLPSCWRTRCWHRPGRILRRIVVSGETGESGGDNDMNEELIVGELIMGLEKISLNDEIRQIEQISDDKD